MTDSDIIDLLELVLTSPYTNTLIRQYVLTTASKLSARFAELSTSTSSTQHDRIAVMLAGFSSNLELELQQRAVEFGSLLTRNDINAGVLERMPPPEIRPTMLGTVSEKKPVGSTRTDKDVIDLIGSDEPATPTTNGSSGPSTQDLLADIFGSAGPSTAPAAGQRSATADIMSLFGTSSPPPPPSTAQPPSSSLFDLGTTSASPAPGPAAPPRQQLQAYPAYDKNGLKITLTPRISPTQAGVVQILAKFAATDKLEAVNFQVAVPKVCSCLAMTNSSRRRRSNYRCRRCLIPTSALELQRLNRCAFSCRQV